VPLSHFEELETKWLKSQSRPRFYCGYPFFGGASFHSFQEFLGLPESEMARLVKGAAIACSVDILRAISCFRPDDEELRPKMVRLIASTLCELGTGTLRLDEMGALHREAPPQADLVNYLVLEAVRQQKPLMEKVVEDLIAQHRPFF
jgi:hypothetical protein